MPTTSEAGGLGEVWRRESPRVLGALARSHGGLQDCEDAAAGLTRRFDDPVAAGTAPAPSPASMNDDVLGLMLLCGLSSLTRSSQVALTLRCVAGLSTDEIAAAFLVPKATMGCSQRSLPRWRSR